MSIRNFIGQLSLRSKAILSVAVAAVMIPTVLSAWGPSRATYTVENPATRVTFNSITNNPTIGDERQFVGIKDAANPDGAWQNSATAQAGHEYLVRVYVHNNAADNLNLVATNTRVMAALSTATSTNVPITAYVSADNAEPKQVHADVNLTSDQQFNIAYVPGTAKIYNNVTGNAGRAVSDSIVNGSGALIGYEANDGKLPGCFKYASYVTFKVKAQFAPSTDFTVSKTVRKTGTTTWGETLAATPGESIQYRIMYKNTGAINQNDVVIRDVLPAGISYVAGTTNLYIASDPNTARKMSDNMFASSGINIGSHAPGASAMIIFNATVATNDKLAVCGLNSLKNIAKVETDYNTKQDTADVTVTKECVTPKDITVCRLSDKKIVTIKESEFDSTKYSKNLDDCKTVVVEKVQACNLVTKKIETVEKSKIDNVTYTLDLSKCKEVVVKDITVCRLSDKKYPVTIKESEFDSTKYSMSADDCKTTPVTPEVPKTPETPVELPKTGIAEGLMGIVGLGSLVASTGYYVASRRMIN